MDFSSPRLYIQQISEPSFPVPVGFSIRVFFVDVELRYKFCSSLDNLNSIKGPAGRLGFVGYYGWPKVTMISCLAPYYLWLVKYNTIVQNMSNGFCSLN